MGACGSDLAAWRRQTGAAGVLVCGCGLAPGPHCQGQRTFQQRPRQEAPSARSGPRPGLAGGGPGEGGGSWAARARRGKMACRRSTQSAGLPGVLGCAGLRGSALLGWPRAGCRASGLLGCATRWAAGARGWGRWARTRERGEREHGLAERGRGGRPISLSFSFSFFIPFI
jgi:hypothetical protein